MVQDNLPPQTLFKAVGWGKGGKGSTLPPFKESLEAAHITSNGAWEM